MNTLYLCASLVIDYLILVLYAFVVFFSGHIIHFMYIFFVLKIAYYYTLYIQVTLKNVNITKIIISLLDLSENYATEALLDPFHLYGSRYTTLLIVI